MRVRTVFLCLLAAAGAMASAQGMPPGFKMPSMRYNPALLMNPDVQKDMHLSKDVSGKVMQVMMEEGMKMAPALLGAMGGKKQSPAEQQKMMTGMMDAFNAMQKRTIAYLTPPQRQRLHEITLQSTGASALLDPMNSREVGLTSAQSTKLAFSISQINRRHAAELGSPMQGGSSNMAAYGAKAGALAKKTKFETDAVLDKLLAPAQKAKWLHMQGRHLDLKGAAGMGGMFGGL